jgi:heme/copper-type cytochrome/quinol oxidase subunit 4
LTILFAAIVIFIMPMVGGSFWIMFDLHHRIAV